MPGGFLLAGATEPPYESLARLGFEVPNSEAPMDFHKPKSPIATQTHTQGQHWAQLEQFFSENERTIARAEGAKLDRDSSAKILDSDYGTTIDLFDNTVTVVLDGLAGLARVHPVLEGVVFAFSAIVRSEMTRRDNDKKVLAVKLQMQSMMCAMFQFRKLRHIHVPESDREGEINDLQRLIKQITTEIMACGSDLDYYAKRNTLSRAISSKVYETKFAGHIATFTQRRSELQLAVAAYTAVGMDAANVGIASIGEKVTSMGYTMDIILTTLQNLSSSRERQLLKFLEDNGGVDKCIDDDRLMNRLLIMSGEVKKGETAVLDRKEQQELQNRRKDLKSDMKNLETALSDNFSRFEKLLQIQSNNLGSQFENQGNKIDQIGSNTTWIMEQLGKVVEKTVEPTGSLNDPVLKAVWDTMGLKGSVKAKHFILNFRDSIYKSSTPLVTPESSPRPSIAIELPETEEDNKEDKSREKHSELISTISGSHQLILQDELRDKWALRYLTVSYVHPIIEAIDEDCSGYISIQEANKFAKARPPGTTLISWMAYWAVGWHRNITEYKNKIYSTILQMHDLARTAHPHNQPLIKLYLNSRPLMRVEALLRSIKSFHGDPQIEDDALLNEYATSIATAQEAQLRQNLDGISYTFQSVNDVKVIANHRSSRVETWILPVLYLVLTRHLNIVVLARKHLLHTDEMTAHEESLIFILEAFQERLDRLEAISHQVYRGHVEAHLKTFAYGMFFVSFKNETHFPSENTLHIQKQSRYWETLNSVDDLLKENPPPISILAKGLGKKIGDDGTDDEDKEDGGKDDINEANEQENRIADKRNDDKEDAVDRDGGADEKDRQGEHPLAGEWSIRYSESDVLECLEIKSANAGKITGKISAVSDRARITGDYKTSQGAPGGILDIEVFVREGDDSIKRILRHGSAVWDPHQEIITGAWVEVEARGAGPAPIPDDKFIARRIPFDFYFLRDIIDSPSSPDSVDGAGPSLAKRRWMYAIECFRSRSKARLMSKDVAVARVKVIRQLIKLHYVSFVQGNEGYIPEESYRQMIVLGIPHPLVSHYFTVHRRLAKYRYERMLDICGYVQCDNCSDIITHVRYQCITCTAEKFDNQVDLCHKCRDVDGVNSLYGVTSFAHRASHSLLQSTPRSWVGKYDLAWLIPVARIASEEVKAVFRERVTSISSLSRITTASVSRASKSNRFDQCCICDTPFSALPVWIRFPNDLFQGYYYHLLCTDCVQNTNTAGTDDYFLLRVFNHVRVWWREKNSTRLEEQMEEMESRINIGLDNRMKELESRVNDQIKGLESRVNDQMEALLSMMKVVLESRTA